MEIDLLSTYDCHLNVLVSLAGRRLTYLLFYVTPRYTDR